MVKHIYDQDAFLEKTGIEKTLLDKLMEAQVLMPAGQVDGSSPYFDERGLEAAETIVKLLEIGYSPDDVIRIRRKVGIPGKGARSQAARQPLLTVGELAQRIGSNPRTIKHWEEKGIIEPESYTPGGFRLYPESYVKICQFIQDLQLFGYTLDEIKGLADLVRDFMAIREGQAVDGAEAIDQRLARMKERMDDLNNKISLLEKGIERWRRLLRQRGKEVAVLSAKIRRNNNAGKDDPAGGGESAPSVAQKTEQKDKQRRKS